MNPLIVTIITTISILLLLWIATLVYHRIKPTEVAYLANIAQVSLIAVTACSFIFVYFQTDQNFRKTTENSDRQFEQQAALTRAQFEQENRAFLEIIAPKIIFSKIVFQDNFPALQFQVSADLKNHGKSPAYLTRTDFILESIDKKIAKPFMPTPEDQEKYIKNLDVFPQETQNLSWAPFLNLNDIGELVSIKSDTIKSIADLIKRTKEDSAPQDFSKINFHTKDCYLIIQTEYSNLGDSNRKYFYSARFRTDLSEGFKNRLVETKIGKSAEEGKWYYVGPRSELSPVLNSTDELTTKHTGNNKNYFGKKPMDKTVKLVGNWGEDVKAICLNVLGGFLAAGLTGLFIYIRRRLRRRALLQVFGDDIVNAIRAHIVHAEFILRPDVQGNVRWPYQKPAGRPPEFSIENPVSGSEARSASYLISALSKEDGKFPSFVSDTQVEGLLDISFIAVGGPDSNLKTADAMRNQGNRLVLFDQANDRMVRVGTSVPLFTREHGFDYGLILKIHPAQFPERVWIVCAGFGEWGTSGAAWYLSTNWKRIHDRWKGAQFAIVVKVQPTQDESAEPVFEIGT